MSEINEMIQGEDDEVLELAKKSDYKRHERDNRGEQKYAPDIEVPVD